MDVCRYDDMDIGGRALLGTSAENNAGAIVEDVNKTVRGNFK